MANETLEQKANVPQEKHEEKKSVSILESAINETFDAVKAGTNLGIGIAAPAAAYALTGNLGVPVTSAAFVAGTKGKKSSKTIRDESLSAAIFGTFAHYTTLPLKYLGKLAKVAYMVPWVFGANAFIMAEDNLIKEKSFKGLYKKFKENYIPITKKAFKSSALINIAASLFLPQTYMVGAVALASYVFRKFVVGGKGEEHKDKTPYLVAASNVTGKFFKNTIGRAYQSIGDLGSAVSDLYKSAPKSTAPATPEAPAH